jgi:hypothetical protein
MTDYRGETGSSENDAGDGAARPTGDALDVGAALSEEDRRILRLWRESLILQDPRYDSKAVLKLAARAMADEEFRSRLVNETDKVLEELYKPEGTTLKFYDNTADTLNVVLPPRAGQMSGRPIAFREILRSRTSSELSESSFRDDFDTKGDVRDIFTGKDGDGTPARD